MSRTNRDVAEFPRAQPRSLLLMKGHSAGIGDLLRSSAAWRALRNRFPEAKLHLWFLTKDPGAASEQLIARHHLLDGFWVSDKRTQGWTGWQRLLQRGYEVVDQSRPDLIVDFEPHGMRTSLLSWLLGRRARAATVGIAQVPLRRLLYSRSAPSTRAYGRRRGLPVPLEYAERDFVALAALNIERRGLPIELRPTPEGYAFGEKLRADLGVRRFERWLGLNIGCGTPDAAGKRPDFDLMAALIRELRQRHGLGLVLTGASNEREINRQFLSRLRADGPVLDLAGMTNLLELAGAIASCSLFISSDSGPYHMAVALRVPTLALFRFPNPEHYHHHEWVDCKVTNGLDGLPALLQSAERLLHCAASHPLASDSASLASSPAH